MSITTLTPAPSQINAPFEAQFDRDRAQLFIIQKLIRGIHTAALVKVLAVRPTAGTVGFVDVQPLVLDQDTNGVVIDQTPIYNIPYFQLQGGISAIILAPVVGDIGLCIFMARDTSNVNKTRQPGAAPTNRAYSSADGLYIGGVLNGDPTQWVKFNPAGGIDISSAGNLTLESAADMTLTAQGNFSITTQGTAALHATGAATMSAASWHFTGAITSDNDITAPELHLPNGPVNPHYHYVPAAPGNSDPMTG